MNAHGVRIGIGLPAAVPGAEITEIGRWAAAAESAGFASVGVIDRLIYENLDPLTALAAAAASTDSIELTTTVANVCWRGNPVLLAKQLSSVAQLSGGRFAAGLGMGGGRRTTRRAACRSRPAAPASRPPWRRSRRPGRHTAPPPRVLLGGTVPASFERAVLPLSEGWVAPLFGLELLSEGSAAVARAWSRAGRGGKPRIVSGRYFSLGPDADRAADEYLLHYYGDKFAAAARADTLTRPDQLFVELRRLAAAGCDDLVLYPCSGDPRQLSLLAEALLAAGAAPARG